MTKFSTGFLNCPLYFLPTRQTHAGHTFKVDQVTDTKHRPNLTFHMPASWEDMEALGLDPLTGEPVA